MWIRRAAHEPLLFRAPPVNPFTAAPRRGSLGGQPAEEDAAAGVMFAADDLPAAGRTASTMLREVRGIRAAQKAQQAQQAQQAAVPREPSAELPVSVSPPDAEASLATAAAAAAAAAGAAPPVAAPAVPAVAAEEGEAREPSAGTPAYRSGALQRLAHIFGGFRGGASAGGGREAGAGEAEGEGEEEQDEEAGLPLSPVHQYIRCRWAEKGGEADLEQRGREGGKRAWGVGTVPLIEHAIGA